jgi:hypothetical protein
MPNADDADMTSRYSKAEVADIIERFLNGGGGTWEWDDFISLRIEDPELDAIRARCNETYEDGHRGWCGPNGIAELTRIMQSLRASKT